MDRQPETRGTAGLLRLWRPPQPAIPPDSGPAMGEVAPVASRLSKFARLRPSLMAMQTVEVSCLKSRPIEQGTSLHEGNDANPPSAQHSIENQSRSDRTRINLAYGQRRPNQQTICHLPGELSTYKIKNTPPLTSVSTISLHHHSATTTVNAQATLPEMETKE